MGAWHSSGDGRSVIGCALVWSKVGHCRAVSTNKSPIDVLSSDLTKYTA